MQISELAYAHQLSSAQTLTLGLLDITGYFDQSRIASDENTQFLGVSFVQNPTIEFPDYALGVVYEHTLDNTTTIRTGLSSSHGISDNPNTSYSQLVDINNSDKGLFVIGSVSWKQPQWVFRSGIWTRTDSHSNHDATRNDLHHYGIYFLTGYQSAPHGVNLRLGAARKEVARAAEFAGLTYQYRFKPFVFGAGMARLFLSSAATTVGQDDTRHYEMYLRYTLRQGLYLTADIQQITNSNFSTLSNARDPNITLYGLRISYVLE